MDNQNQVTQPAPDPLPQGSENHIDDMKPLSRSEKLKRSFLQVLIGCLLASSGVAVIAVLMGIFNDTLGRALGTIAMIALHALLSFSYVTKTEKRDKQAGGRSIDLFSNAVFTLVVVSFITSVFAIWQLLSGTVTFKLYLFYGVVLFATLHADVLYRIRGFEKRINNIVTANYICMTAVVTMLTVVIFFSSESNLGEFFYRLLAATGIVDATMTITAVIMHKLYLQKHPKLAVQDAQATTTVQSKNFWKNPLVILLLIFLVFQVIGSLIALIVRGF